MANGIIFNSELTSLYEQKEVSGPMLDTRGNKDWQAISAGAVHNGNSVTYPGVNEVTTSKTLANGTPFDPNADYTFYIHLKPLSVVGNENERWFRPRVSATNIGPLISPKFGSTIGNFEFESHQSAGKALIQLTMGRDFKVSEECLVIISQDHSTKTISGVLYSKDELAPLALSGTGVGTVDPTFTSTRDFRMFDNLLGVFSHVELLEVGAIAGTFKTEAELQAAAESWLLGPSQNEDQIRRAIILQSSPRTT